MFPATQENKNVNILIFKNVVATWKHSLQGASFKTSPYYYYYYFLIFFGLLDFFSSVLIFLDRDEVFPFRSTHFYEGVFPTSNSYGLPRYPLMKKTTPTYCKAYNHSAELNLGICSNFANLSSSSTQQPLNFTTWCLLKS